MKYQRTIYLVSGAACLLLAVGLILYPILGNALAEKNKSLVMTEYSRVVEEMTDTCVAEMLAAAEAYNAALSPISVSADGAYSLTGLTSAQKQYDEILAVNESGIMGQLEIPELDIRLPIYHGTDGSTLEKGVWQKFTEWLKELLVSGIMDNVNGLFDNVNSRVAGIAGQVGATPQGWNSGVYGMIRTLSDNVILPIAGVVLAFVMTLELIQLITEKNNMHDVDTWMFFKWIFKTACAVLIVTNTWNIVMGVFEAAQSVVNSASGIIISDTSLTFMDGFGPSQIARKLRERKILTPAAYYESKGIPCNVKKQGDPYGWDNTTIAGIMDRWREYLGHTVNFKTTKKSYKSKKKIKNPESEWVIFENTHEPIWTEAIAEAVKQARQSRRRPTKMGEMGMFSGMMYCADCGSILYQCRATGFRKDQEYYICSGYRKGKQVCGTPHSIRTVILEELILQNLREIVSFARSHENRFVQMVMDMDVKERNKGLAKKRKLLSEGEKRITELDMIFKRLYEDNISGKLTDERFHKLSTDYEAEQAGLQTQAAILREEIEEVEGKSANVDRFLSVVRQYTDIPELTPRILHEFVEKIVIHAATDPHSKINRRQEVDIYYKGIGILEMSKVFDSRQK